MAGKPTALVTGGVKRVGRAIAIELFRSGYDVAVTYLTSEADAASLREMGIVTLKADLSEPKRAVEAITAALAGRFDRLDVLVNNASAFLPGATMETMHRVEAIHVHSPMLLCQRFEQPLRVARGSVINMVDLLAEKPWPEYLAYCASKAALANLTIGLAKLFAPDVTVNGIAPGVVEWPADYPAAERARYLSRVPLARSGTPEDVAKLVRFLCTDGKYMTGQIVRLDGGRSVA